MDNLQQFFKSSQTLIRNLFKIVLFKFQKGLAAQFIARLPLINM
jgi:hypothetical protein